MELKWLGHASFMLKGSKIIYIDPFKLAAGVAADIILITHSHFDHCSPDDVKKIIKPGTIVIGPADCALATQHLLPGASKKLGSVEVTAVPAYNTNKRFHQKSSNWVGYVVRMDGVSVYHAGDTDFIPEMAQLKDIDYALLPIGGTYTMTAEEAAKAADIIKPKVAFPMHYGSIVGSSADAELFKRLCHCTVAIGKI
jgi:L-ascorbate metabolism protein UlaG (beta-lactamase superfamily)